MTSLIRTLAVYLAMASIVLETIVHRAAAAPTQSSAGQAGGALAEYQQLKSGLQERKREMCSFLLNDLDNRQDEQLDLNKVTRLFEAALEHLATTSSYVTLMSPYVGQDIIKNFDQNAGTYVLDLSNTRRYLIEEYKSKQAGGASEEELRQLLEKYFFKACESKLSTIVTEKSMYEQAKKAEKLLKVKLVNADGKSQ